MARRPLATSRPLIAFLLGLAGALAAGVFHLTDLDRRGELYALDLRFKHASSAAPPNNILHVDIDDRSLAEVGRWPWPRQTQAEIVSVLHECGARAIALDIIMPEPQKVRYVSEADTIYGADDSAMLRDAKPAAVLDDAALMWAIYRCGNVMLPMHVEFAEDAAPRAPAEPLAARVRQMLTASPDTSFVQVRQAILGSAMQHRTTQETADLENAYLRLRAIRALDRITVPGEHVGDGRIEDASITPPLVPFAQLAHGSGFVTFKPDPDKAIRRIPLLARSDGLIYPQFALAVATDELARRHGGSCTIKADADSVTLKCTDGTTRSIPVDRRGWMLIHWARRTWPPEPSQSRRFRIPAASVARLSQERRRLERLKDQAQFLRDTLLTMEDVKPVNDRLNTLTMTFLERKDDANLAYQALLNAKRQMLIASLYDPSKEVDPDKLTVLAQACRDSEIRLADVTRQIVAGLRKGENLDVFLGKPVAGEPADAEAQAAYLARKKAATQMLIQLDSLNADIPHIEANVIQLRDELVPIIKGKICMVGSTSTGAADFVPCPLGARTPGVVVHSNIIDTILDGRFIYEAHWSVNLLAILLAGAAAAAAAALRPVVQAAGIAVVIAGAYVLLNAYVVFGLWSVWLAAVSPLVAVLASFLVVTAYRQLTEERGKRQLKAMLVQTLSPEVVEEVLKDPSLLDPGGQKVALTCMFSDLAGFTPLSEQLGPQETVRLLNRYFDGATDAIAARWGGWVNKFLGDGIFAIFGVPVRPERHAMRAVEAAIDCQQAVDQLNVELSREAGVTAQLSVRIGITTGEAMVGNCGSTTKADLTAIGNYVNQASRLEAANKSFNTRIIVASETWAACDRQALLARPLGRVFIVGVSEAVRVWHVLGRAETLGDELRPALDDFARAVDLFGEQDFAGTLALLETVDRAMPDDKATAYYMHLCRQCAARPADDESWRPVHATKGVARIALPWQDVNPNEHTK